MSSLINLVHETDSDNLTVPQTCETAHNVRQVVLKMSTRNKDSKVAKGWSEKDGSSFTDLLHELKLDQDLDVKREYSIYVGKGNGSIGNHHRIIVESEKIKLTFELLKESKITESIELYLVQRYIMKMTVF